MKTTMRNLAAAGVIGLMAMSFGVSAQDTNPTEAKKVSTPDYVCLPMPVFKMLTTDRADSQKQTAPEFFVYGKDGKLAAATSNLGDMMKPKDRACKSDGKPCDMKNGKGMRGGMMMPQPGMEKTKEMRGQMMRPQFERENKFVLMSFNEFSTLSQQKADKMGEKGKEMVSKMLERVQSGKGTVDATVDGGSVKVFMMKPGKHHGKHAKENHCDKSQNNN